eukprot:CAMPEP_0118937772 /NCGR_PEP_ID=MMETSP1169-20130426/23778_1 /TAXON_ID=36882 /ORGANISM="Pyramimonas obovata, Strain CCMP722" /LENGTH=229 /DNA_ID=CAMNT_0006881513 /DNA_START=426 /DNA_END=1112 /DNA_ORIENTATION=+
MLARPLSRCSRDLLGARAGLRPGHDILLLGARYSYTTCIETTSRPRGYATFDFEAVGFDSLSLNADHRNQIAHNLRQLAEGSSIGERIWRKSVHEAAVVIPLCHVAGKASVAFTVRPEDEERNSCSFPYVLLEDKDKEFSAPVLRAGELELGLRPTDLHILGFQRQAVDAQGSTVITPALAYIGELAAPTLKPQSGSKISAIFTAPLEDLLSPKCLTYYDIPHPPGVSP